MTCNTSATKCYDDCMTVLYMLKVSKVDIYIAGTLNSCESWSASVLEKEIKWVMLCFGKRTGAINFLSIFDVYPTSVPLRTVFVRSFVL